MDFANSLGLLSWMDVLAVYIYFHISKMYILSIFASLPFEMKINASITISDTYILKFNMILVMEEMPIYL